MTTQIQEKIERELKNISRMDDKILVEEAKSDVKMDEIIHELNQFENS